MSVSPDVSIIVPVYNSAAGLAAALDSLLGQSLPSTELIVVNDGSTDDSTSICREYARRYPGRLKLIEQSNGGVGAARNAGLAVAAGDWIYFADSDDIAEPEVCAVLLALAVDNHAEMSCCALQCDSSEREDIRTNLPGSGDEVLEIEAIRSRYLRPLLRLNWSDGAVRGYCPISLFRREVIERHGLRFTPGMTFAEDEAFILRYLPYVTRLALTSRVLYHYRLSENSACARIFRKRAAAFHEQERNWFLTWDNRLRVYREHRLAQFFPEAGAALLINTLYHRSQWVLSDSRLSAPERKRELDRVLAAFRSAAGDREFWRRGKLSRAQQGFKWMLSAGRPGIGLFCRLARWRKMSV